MSAGDTGPPVLFLMGPTGAGKTAVALELARRHPFEIVSVDSAMVYRGLDIGSAKPSPVLLAQTRHHLIDICDPEERYSAARFREDATHAIGGIRARGHVPLLVGGTGLYFRVLERGIARLPQGDPAVRARLAEERARAGNDALHRRLQSVDPESAAKIHPHDPQRVMRALEVWELTGTPMSHLIKGAAHPPMAQRALKCIVAPADRNDLRQRLARRFEAMLDQGLVNEVRSLRGRPGLSPALPSMRAVGYHEVWRYLDGEFGYAEMIARAIIATRQLAKRQYTWLRAEADAHWFESADAGLAARIESFAAKHQIMEKIDYTNRMSTAERFSVRTGPVDGVRDCAREAVRATGRKST